jgi:hypothetical protein
VSKKSFQDLLQLHTKLDDLFLNHQRALLRLDVEKSRIALELFEADLLAHMCDEEELMIPLYRDRARIPIGGCPEICLGEHGKLLQHISKFEGGNNRTRERGRGRFGAEGDLAAGFTTSLQTPAGAPRHARKKDALSVAESGYQRSGARGFVCFTEGASC